MVFRQAFVYSHTIKLIFSKPVRYAQFKLGRNTGNAVNVINAPDYTICRLPDSKAEEVFVWTGGLLDTVLDLYYGVVSANDMLGPDPSTGMLIVSTTAANKTTAPRGRGAYRRGAIEGVKEQGTDTGEKRFVRHGQAALLGPILCIQIAKASPPGQAPELPQKTAIKPCL
ncbi:MAG: hypothetical protein LBD55_13080 [Treponema sp.]|jgi:hypothetical protein|nr:hypothetical protein [Treponema sp.]